MRSLTDQPWPNHALQRTAPRVTVAASGLRLSPTTQLPRRAPQSLSLESLGDFAHLIRAMSALEDIPSPMRSSKRHGLKNSSSESIASPAVWPPVALRIFCSRRFPSSQASVASEFDATLARHPSRGDRVHTLHAQQLRASRPRGGSWLSFHRVRFTESQLPGIHARASIASPGVAPGTLFLASILIQ